MTTQEQLINGKLGLLKLAAYMQNVSEACKTLGYSRDTFYRLKRRYEEAGIEGLREISRRKPNPGNRVPQEIEDKVVALALEYPAFGQVRIAAKLLELHGLTVSPAGVRCIWQRHELETKKKRLRALEVQVAKEGYVLTESQLQAPEQATKERRAYGEIESDHPVAISPEDAALGRDPQIQKSVEVLLEMVED